MNTILFNEFMSMASLGTSELAFMKSDYNIINVNILNEYSLAYRGLITWQA